jgi:hypothetical protein
MKGYEDRTPSAGGNMKTATEFWEAQQLAKDEDGTPLCRDGKHVWFRLGGKTLEDAREAVRLARKVRKINARFICGETMSDYRIRHFVGTVETVE